jgi:serine/threonine-protein kinase
VARSPGADGESPDPTKTSDHELEHSAGPLGQPSPDGGRFTPGTVLADRYRIVGLLGRGGMGEVYRADDLKLRQTVALKLLPPGLAVDPLRLARFHDEVRLARQVSHPNVCRVHDIGEAGGLTFLTMEHVDGEDLASLLRRVGRLPAERALPVARQICAGLGAAHERGVLHRDLKPANVMIDGRGRARLTDFGLAVLARDARAGESAGTPAYMAPEQVEGREISERTDVYALGLVLYELFTGRRAFEADTMASLAEARSSAPPPPSVHVPDLDPRIEQAILQCLEKDPSRRPGAAMAVAAALSGADALAAAIAAGETPSPEMVAAAGEGVGLRPGVAVVLAALAVAGHLLGAVWVGQAALFNRIPLDKPPEALAERARAILARVGTTAAPADQAFGFAYDRRYIRWLQAQGRPLELSDRGRAPLRFWYRQSARPMVPYNDVLIVTQRDPPLDSGMALLQLDTQGRLLELLAPADGATATASPNPPAWDALIEEAGLDARSLRPSSAAWLPPFYADTLAEFEGTFPREPAIPLRIQAAALAGRPVAFRLRGPWDEAAVAPPAVGGQVLVSFTTALLVPVLAIALLLARRNDRLGRSDRRGAFRIAVFVFCSSLLAAILLYGHSASPLREWRLFGRGAGQALFDAATAWVLYLALEPYVRRRWPEALVSWNRLLAGRFKDPLVGRDLLVGALASAAALTLLPLFTNATPAGDGRTPLLLLDAYLPFLTAPRRVIAWLLGFMAVMAVTFALVNVLLIVLLRALLRSRAAATAALCGLWFLLSIPGMAAISPQTGPLSAQQLLLLAGVSAISAFVFVRNGLLAGAAYYLMLAVLECPALTRFGAWYAQPSLVVFSFVACLIGWGLYTSLSARPFRFELLDR